MTHWHIENPCPDNSWHWTEDDYYVDYVQISVEDSRVVVSIVIYTDPDLRCHEIRCVYKNPLSDKNVIVLKKKVSKEIASIEDGDDVTLVKRFWDSPYWEESIKEIFID
jgi:hypothetical protein